MAVISESAMPYSAVSGVRTSWDKAERIELRSARQRVDLGRGATGQNGDVPPRWRHQRSHGFEQWRIPSQTRAMETTSARRGCASPRSAGRKCRHQIHLVQRRHTTALCWRRRSGFCQSSHVAPCHGVATSTSDRRPAAISSQLRAHTGLRESRDRPRRPVDGHRASQFRARS